MGVCMCAYVCAYGCVLYGWVWVYTGCPRKNAMLLNGNNIRLRSFVDTRYVWVCDDTTVVCFVGILCELNAGDVFGGER